MSTDLTLNGHIRSTHLSPAEQHAYTARLAAAVERARADLSERVANGEAPGDGAGRFARPDDLDDRIEAGDAVVVELRNIGQSRLQSGLPLLAPHLEEQLKTVVLNDALGLGPLEPYRNNDRLEELAINKDGIGFAWWDDGSKTCEGRILDGDAATIALSQRVARRHGQGGQRLDQKTPFMRVDLPGGHRFVAALGGDGNGGVSSGALISLRRKRITNPTLDDLVARRMFPQRLAEQGRIMVRGGAGIIVPGPMASGKTTVVGAMLHERNPDERCATFERDVMELNLLARNPDADVIELYTKSANTEGEGAVELGELIARTRQFRIDRNIVGELVHGADGWEMLSASSGATYRSMATLHADDPTITLSRLALYCAAHPTKPTQWEVRELISQTIDVVWFCELLIVDGRRRRRVTSVREVGGITETGAIASSEIWGYDFATDTFRQTQAWSAGFLERLRRRGLDITVMIPDEGLQ